MSTAQSDRPVVGYVNYSFFSSTQSFIFHYLVAHERFRPICLTRTPEVRSIRAVDPRELTGDLYTYEPRGGSSSALWSTGLAARRLLTRLPSRLTEPALELVNRGLAPRLRADADAGAYLSWARPILAERGARILQAHFLPVGFRALQLKRELGIPLVVTSLGDDVAPKLPPWWWWWIRDGRERPDWPARMRELFAGADLFLAEGPHLRSQLIEYGCPPEKARLQRMALPLELFPFRERGAQPGRDPIIVFAGRFCEQKGVLNALAAVNVLRRRGLRFELRLIGDETMTDGHYAARVYAYIRDHKLGDRVRLLGWQNQERCRKEMERADIFLAPSVVDADGRGEGGAPTTILEAQALGMPVVSTRHCDIPYVTRPGTSAELVPERDDEALAEVLAQLLAHPERWPAMGRAGREHVERNHDIRREAARLEEAYMALGGLA